MGWYGIVVARNCQDTIVACVGSLFGQMVPPDKIIVVNDGSTDHTVPMLARLKDTVTPRLQVISTDSTTWDYTRKPKLWNMALEPNHEFVLLADGDTAFQPDYVEKLLQAMDANPDLVVCSGNYRTGDIAPRGLGRMIRQSYMDEVYTDGFPEQCGYESEILYRAHMMGYSTRLFEDVHCDHLSELGGRHKFGHWGASMRALGYHPAMAIGRCLIERRIPASGRLRMLCQYLAFKDDNKWNQYHDSALRWHVRHSQGKRIRAKIRSKVPIPKAAGRLLGRLYDMGKYPDSKTADHAVLHVGSVNNVARLMLNNVRRHGWDGICVMRSASDPFETMKGYLNIYRLDIPPYRMLHEVNKRAGQYPILHVHFNYHIIPDLRRRWPDKKIIMHYHGADLLNCPDDTHRIKCVKKADLVLYPRRDMADKAKDAGIPVRHLPLAPDTNVFCPYVKPEKDVALLMQSWRDDKTKVELYLHEYCPWKYEVYDRERNPIPYQHMPRFLRKYPRYINCRYIKDRETGILDLGCTQLEALACGLQVWDAYSDTIHTKLPEENTPEYQGEQLRRIYDSLIK